MNRSRKAFAALAAAVLLVPAAAVTVLTGSASADADGKHRHDLDTYKREAWFEIKAGDPELHEHMYCDDGDYALDGMWKVDAYDGDDRSVIARASYADPAEENEWHFRLNNTGPGRAQIKLFVTCLDNRTGERDGHSHLLSFRVPASVDTPYTVAGGVFSTSHTCLANEIPVSPGFLITTAARVYRSYPTAGELGWQFAFSPVTDGTVTTYIKCLSATTTSAGTPAHTHEIDFDLLPGYGGQHEALGAGEAIERSISSRPHDEGNVGGFWIDDPTNVTYLGQDARGQIRTTRFWFTGAGSGNTWLVVWGLDKRTKKNS